MSEKDICVHKSPSHCVSVKHKSYAIKFNKIGYTPEVKVDFIIQGSFFIENQELEPMIATVQSSVDKKKWVDDNYITIPGESVHILVAYFYAKYYRIKLSSDSLNLTKAKINFIAQTYMD